MQRFSFSHNQIQLSYLDNGGDGKLLVCLHGHFGCARNFAPLAQALAPAYRVVALDQRGHGWSEHASDSSRAAYVADALALLDLLSPHAPAFLLGHSLGGVNAYQLAARHPSRVSALVVEDVGSQLAAFPNFGTDWPTRFASLSDLFDFLGSKGLRTDRHFFDSICEFTDGWGFRFNAQWMARSQRNLNGDWRADWLQLRCPTLLLRGTQSWATQAEDLDWMAAQHPACQYLELEGGHTLHDQLPQQYTQVVRRFLDAAAGAQG
jgi:esterase